MFHVFSLKEKNVEIKEEIFGKIISYLRSESG